MPTVLVKLVIPGRLRGKGRPRAQIRHGKQGQQFVHVHPDDKTLNAEALFRSMAAESMSGRPPFEGPLTLKVQMIFNRTASWSAKKKAAAVHVVGKPDCDNVLKLIGDAGNGILWGDDAQLCEIHLRRLYDDSTGEHVNIWVMAPDGAALQDQPKPPSNGATLNLVLPLPPAPPKPAAEPRKPASFKIGDRVHSIAVGTKAEFEGVVIETDGKNYVVEEGLLGKPWMRAHSELFPAKGD